MRRRVVVTGMGCVNPLGHNAEAMWSALKEGQSGVGYTTIFDASKFPTKISAEVKNWEFTGTGDDADIWKLRARHTKFACGSAQQAVAQSGLLDANIEPTRIGVYLGCGEGSQDFMAFSHMMTAALRPDGLDLVTFARTGLEILNPVAEIEQEPNMPAGYVAALFNARGPSLNCLTACAASTQAIGEATEIIRHGDADVMISGGAHSMIHPFGVTGFNRLTALSTFNDNPKSACRPFDATRGGFVLGEGSGVVILESLEHAQKRGVKVLAEIAGYGSSADAYRVTDQHPEGRGAIVAIKEALRDAEMSPRDIHYINAHGTGTKENDSTET